MHDVVRSQAAAALPCRVALRACEWPCALREVINYTMNPCLEHRWHLPNPKYHNLE